MLIGPQNSTLNVNHVRSRIRQAAAAAGRDPAAITLVAVTKAQTAETARLAATAGVTDFGENYLQEALPKMDRLADLGARWHFIGGVQSNKTRVIAERFDWVHSIDRLSIARRLSEQRPYHAAPLNLCIQVELVPEPRKGGVEPGEHLRRRQRRVDIGQLAVEQELAAFDQLHRRDAGDRLGHRGDAEHRVELHRRSGGEAADAERALVEDAPGIGRHRDDARHLAAFGGLAQYRVDPSRHAKSRQRGGR